MQQEVWTKSAVENTVWSFAISVILRRLWAVWIQMEETKEEIRLLIEQKNYASLTDILGKAQENKVLQSPQKASGAFWRRRGL